VIAMMLGILAVIVAGPLTVVLAWGLVSRTIPKLLAARKGASAEGRVLRINAKSTSGNVYGSGAPARRADIEFTAREGLRIGFTEAVDLGVECRKGQQVIVHYDPASPKDSATIKDAYDVATGLMVMSGVTLMFALTFVFGVYLIAKGLH
jgi:hypothetical protein